jgi:hypothetical protein
MCRCVGCCPFANVLIDVERMFRDCGPGRYGRGWCAGDCAGALVAAGPGQGESMKPETERETIVRAAEAAGESVYGGPASVAPTECWKLELPGGGSQSGAWEPAQTGNAVESVECDPGRPYRFSRQPDLLPCRENRRIVSCVTSPLDLWAVNWYIAHRKSCGEPELRPRAHHCP